MRRNRKRAKFMERLNKLLKEYNLGAHDIDQLLNDLMDLAKDLNEEEQRHVQEGLTEDVYWYPKLRRRFAIHLQFYGTRYQEGVYANL